MSKLLTMVDQLRQVHPDLENATDPEVEALKKTVDPHESVKVLNQSLEEAESNIIKCQSLILLVEFECSSGKFE
jgi:hypothetical protein